MARRRYYRRRSKDSDLLASVVLLVVIGGGLAYKLSDQVRTASAILFVILFILIGIAGFLFIMIVNAHQRARMRALSVADVDQMDPFKFEHYVAELLRSQGFGRVEVTQASGDYGVDVTGIKDNQKWAVQAKHYHGRVGIEAVQQAFAGCNYYRCQRSMVVTTAYFTPAAKALALANATALIDRNQLADWIINLRQGGVKAR